MVLVDVLCAMNLVASVMVNGACCCYQMNEQNERRKEQEMAIQRSIRSELDLHRLKEMAQKRNEMIQAYNDAAASRLQDERRRKLMSQKANIMAAGNNSNNTRDQPIECNRADPTITTTNIPLITTNNSFSSTMVKSKDILTSKDVPSKLLVLSRGFLRNDDESRRNSCLTQKLSGEFSSLFDDSLDDDDDDDEYELEEIFIE